MWFSIFLRLKEIIWWSFPCITFYCLFSLTNLNLIFHFISFNFCSFLLTTLFRHLNWRRQNLCFYLQFSWLLLSHYFFFLCIFFFLFGQFFLILFDLNRIVKTLKILLHLLLHLIWNFEIRTCLRFRWDRNILRF